MFVLSGFADEIAPDFDQQLKVAKEIGLKYICLRSVWDKNILDLSDQELARVKTALDQSGIKVSSIGSPIGKVAITEEFAPHLARFKQAVKVALFMQTRFIRVFSFYLDQADLDKYESEVVNRLRIMTEIAAANELVIVHENEAGIYGASSERCVRLFELVDHPNFRAAFDPANFVIAGENVSETSWPRLKPYVLYMHIKDCLRNKGGIVLAGKGDGDIATILRTISDPEPMFLTLEPHLAEAGSMRGFSGPDLFAQAYHALVKILEDIGVTEYM